MIQREFDFFDCFCSKAPIFRQRLLALDNWIADETRGLGTYEFCVLDVMLQDCTNILSIPGADPVRGKFIRLNSVHASSI